MPTGTLLGHCKFENFVSAGQLGLSSQLGATSLLDIVSDEKYIPSFSSSRDGSSRIRIYLREDATSRDTLKAWIHAIELVHLARDKRKDRSKVPSFSDGDILDMINETRQTILRTHPSFCEELKRQGWDLETGSLLTSEIARFRITNDGNDASKKETKKDI